MHDFEILQRIFQIVQID